MFRSAIFVDAGYLFAQGSVTLAGIKQPRSILSLNITAAIAELKAVASTKAPTCDLLRIYWYDGASSTRGPTLEQMNLAHTDSVKLRLGFINSSGEQKGVDSLIVTDLIDLARNHAICDAILVSGDEDVRVGVQIAQQFGVRIHLLGIAPARGSQSRALQQEADTTTEWDRATVQKFLSMTAPAIPAKAVAGKSPPPGKPNALDAKVQGEILAYVSSLKVEDCAALAAHWVTAADIPAEFDRPLLGKSRDALGRDLSPEERKAVRNAFKASAKDRSKP